jgi:homoserine dehydrogenase
MIKENLNIGLFGFGCVGEGLYQVLNESKLLNASIKKIVVKNKEKERNIGAENFSYNKYDILNDPDINLVVELIDDADAAFEIVKKAMEKGKHVVTANKKMVANHLEELIEIKKANGVSFLYEGAVCGSIPIIRNLEEYYNNDCLTSINAISNGTCNYILTRLDLEKASFAEILKDAQLSGFAESDPTLDIDGFDSKFKLSILIAHAFGVVVAPDEIINLGIRHIKEKDLTYAKEKGYKIKLISQARKIDNTIEAYVIPQFIAKDSYAFDINFEFNGVLIEAAFSDKQVFKGKGAGAFPTGSAVLSDISSLQFLYDYEYKKRHQDGLQLATDFLIKIFVSSANEKSLNDITLSTVEESYTSKNYAYKVGLINKSQLTYEFYSTHPELFIAVAAD